MNRIMQMSQVTKLYDDLLVLDKLDLSIIEGRSNAIIGVSGSGKSTILNILATFLSPTSGNIYFQEDLIRDLSKFRLRELGFIMQTMELFEGESLIYNILVKGAIAREDTSKGSLLYSKAIRLIENLGLRYKIDSPISNLSIGEKKRVAIARSLILDPSILLADEPTGNLDEDNASMVQDMMLDICRKFKKTLLVVTHDVKFAKKCDHSWVLNKGKLL